MRAPWHRWRWFAGSTSGSVHGFGPRASPGDRRHCGFSREGPERPRLRAGRRQPCTGSDRHLAVDPPFGPAHRGRSGPSGVLRGVSQGEWHHLVRRLRGRDRRRPVRAARAPAGLARDGARGRVVAEAGDPAAHRRARADLEEFRALRPLARGARISGSARAPTARASLQ